MALRWNTYVLKFLQSPHPHNLRSLKADPYDDVLSLGEWAPHCKPMKFVQKVVDAFCLDWERLTG